MSYIIKLYIHIQKHPTSSFWWRLIAANWQKITAISWLSKIFFLNQTDTTSTINHLSSPFRRVMFFFGYTVYNIQLIKSKLRDMIVYYCIATTHLLVIAQGCPENWLDSRTVVQLLLHLDLVVWMVGINVFPISKFRPWIFR